MSNAKLWTDKYTPQRLDDIIGHAKSIEEIQDWAEKWEKGKKQEPLLIHGATGIGKTATVLALVKEHGWELLELNASDLRNSKRIERIAGHASLSRTFSGKPRLILFDEIDGLYRQDRGGAGAVVRVLKSSEYPIILTANDIWDPKLSSIRSACKRIDMKKVHYATIAKYLEDLAEKEKLKVDKEIFSEIARNCSGDVRSAINDLQLLTQGMEKVTRKDLEVLGERDREDNIFNAIRIILKTKTFKESRDALKNLREDPDFILKWIDENLPKEYKKPEDLYRAYDYVSRADVFLGRVYRRQYYGLWRYASDLMSTGVSLSKEETYSGFTRYSFPSMIRYLSSSKSTRAMRKSIASKIGKQCHVSTKVAIKDYVPMFFELMKDKEKAVRLAAQFEFTEDELKFFGMTNPSKVFEEAEELRVEYIKEASKIKPDKHQRGLHQF